MTKRQWQLLFRLGRGLGDKEIAAELGLTPLTVKSYICILRKKFGMNRYQLVVFGCRAFECLAS